VSVLELDETSLLVHVAAHTDHATLDGVLRPRGLTLDARFDGAVADWLGRGAPGARSAWLDPADHLVAGWTARTRDTGEAFTIRPAPRRAVGPDLLALVLGVRGRFLGLESVWLRVHRLGVLRPKTEAFAGDADALGPDEEALFDAIDTALGATSR
jgi:alkyldihydroxyacetonephosphate synthase